MFPTALRRLAESAGPTFANVVKKKAATAASTTTVLKKVWPPDFAKLSHQEQLRLEKKYKRRIQLAMARPQWHRFIRLAQLFTITFVVIYSVLFMDTKAEKQPFEQLRHWFWGLFGIASSPPPENFDRRKNAREGAPMAAVR